MQNVCWHSCRGLGRVVCGWARCSQSEFSLVPCVHLHFSVLRISNFICFDLWRRMRWVRTRLLMHSVYGFIRYFSCDEKHMFLSEINVGTAFPSLNIWTLIEWTRALMELLYGVDFSAHHFAEFGVSAEECILIQSNDGSLSHLITAWARAVTSITYLMCVCAIELAIITTIKLCDV